MGRVAYAFGTQRRTGPPRSHSSWKNPKRSRSAYPRIALRGSQSSLFAKSSQKGVPVFGWKCHCTISRTWASKAFDTDFIADRLSQAQRVRQVQQVHRVHRVLTNLMNLTNPANPTNRSQ